MRRASSLVLAIVVAAGCGGGGGKRLSRDQYASKADAVCRKYNAQAKLLVAPTNLSELGKAFEALHPGTKVSFSFDASSALATQANNAAPADIFASADQANMKKVTDAGNATGPRVFAHNRLAIVVAKGNPKKLTGLADFDRRNVTFVLCAAEVPCGKYGAQALAKAGVKAQPKSLEANVKAVVTKVTSGEVDAGIAYVTDAKAAAASAQGVEIPDQYNVVAEYPVAVLKQAANSNLAYAFLDYLLGPDAQAVLAKFGFTGP